MQSEQLLSECPYIFLFYLVVLVYVYVMRAHTSLLCSSFRLSASFTA